MSDRYSCIRCGGIHDWLKEINDMVEKIRFQCSECNHRQEIVFPEHESTE